MSVYLGSINNHLDVDVKTPREGDVLTFIHGKWRGVKAPSSGGVEKTFVEIIREPDMSLVDPLRKSLAELQVRVPTESKLKKMVQSIVAEAQNAAPAPAVPLLAPPGRDPALEPFELRPSVEPAGIAVIKTSRGQVLKTGRNGCFWFYIVLKADAPDLSDKKITVRFSSPARISGPKKMAIAGSVSGFTEVEDSLLDKLSLSYESGLLQVQFNIESHADSDIWTLQGSGAY